MGKKKKNRNQDPISKVVLITAILELINKLYDLLDRLIE